MKNKRYLSALFSIIALSSLVNSADAQLADGKCKFLGNIIADSPPSSFNTYWNQVTPENSGKWGSVEGTRDVMNWGSLDLAYNHANNNGFLFKQHTFVWGQQQPAWISTLMNDTSIPQEERYQQVRDEVEEWIQLYCERYPDTDFIDVVNEPLHAIPSYSLALGTGWNWMIWAFQKARQYCPNSKLHLNDYNIINNDATTDNYIALINLLKAENLIDGIGIQGHRFEVESTPVNQLKNNLDKLAATDLPVYISEFDIGNLNNASSGNSTTDDNEQLQIYQRVFPVLWEHKAVHGITIWGYLQGQTWQSTTYLVRSDGTERPALTWLKNYILTTPGGSFCYTTSVNEGDELNLQSYPNPVRDGHLVLESAGDTYKVMIRDMQGRVIQKVEVTEKQQVDVHLQLNSGVYILEIFNGHKTTFRKILAL